jgi:hypothetical protein
MCHKVTSQLAGHVGMMSELTSVLATAFTFLQSDVTLGRHLGQNVTE